jgi:transposase
MNVGYLGIDVSKGYSDFVLVDKVSKQLEPVFQLDDNVSGHSKLLHLLEEFKTKHGLDGFKAVLESTGGYENNWVSFLSDAPAELNLQVARVNPYGVKHDGQAGMERTITDGTSARRIALYAIHHPDKLNWESSGVDLMYSLRSMYNYIRTKVKQKVQLGNQLEKLLYSAFPELLQYAKEDYPGWLLRFLEQYPTAKQAGMGRVRDFASIAHISEKKAKELHKKAVQSISKTDNPALQEIIKGYAKDIRQLDKDITSLKKSLAKQTGLPFEIELLTSFQGIATYSAVGLMVEIENVERFESSKKICSFFGVHPKFKQSGDKISKVQMSKQGSPQIRAVLFMIAKSAIVYNPHIRAIYNRFREQGMNYKQAMGVIMHKILRIVYGMLKTRTPYKPQVDKNKQLQTAIYRSKTMNEAGKKNGVRRFADDNTEAPISKRQEKKRKEQLTSPKLE